ncbi:beta-xylosidase [Penicillium atrosanguineum]|uniref:Beta-xylosidase n=1 Tax=Penicillium atrosanguineum TaxID=1132637 RepID=A0A9W9PV24_9EURO|nr:beta-xylosidase [Penicillium atrosanguineum]KAJ5314880.1 beta-xylosidase [Penicillium atrosanguineum]
MTLGEKINNTQYDSPGVSRLGLPMYNWWSEGLHGVAGSPGVHFAENGPFSYATSFPSPIVLGSMFDDDLVKQIATMISTEGRAFGNTGHSGFDFWTPNINPFKDPRWVVLIDGLQNGIGPAQPRIVATCKHSAAYDLEDWGNVTRHTFDAIVSTQDLSEYYLPSFRSCTRDARVDAVTSNCGAIDDIYLSHNYTSTGAEVAAVALNAGTDFDCGSDFPDYLGSSLAHRLTTTKALNKAMIRRYSSLIKLGYFDPGKDQLYGSLGWSDVGTPAAQELAQRAAVEGIVLLKNNNTLPLAPNKTGATDAGYKVNFALGTEINTTTTTGFDPAVSVAKQADIVIYAGGIDDTIEAEGHDRMSIDWPGNQFDLIQRLAQVGKPLVVVQFGGGQLDGSTLLSNDHVGALLWAGYPGQAGGAAVSDILTGNEAPAGRLPVTQYPAEYVNDVAMTDMSLRPSSDNPGRTYQWYKDAVLSFGYGLHYTSFHVAWTEGSLGPYSTSRLAMHASNIAPVVTALFGTFTLTITNSGKVTSDYVALMFLTTDNTGPTPYPSLNLVGYQRVKKIKPRETHKVDIVVTLGSVARTAENGDLVLYPGTYMLQVDVGCKYPTASFSIVGGQKVLDLFPSPPNQIIAVRDLLD